MLIWTKKWYDYMLFSSSFSTHLTCFLQISDEHEEIPISISSLLVPSLQPQQQNTLSSAQPAFTNTLYHNPSNTFSSATMPHVSTQVNDHHNTTFPSNSHVIMGHTNDSYMHTQHLGPPPPHKHMKPRVTMGPRADCEKCRMKVPGHYLHRD